MLDLPSTPVSTASARARSRTIVVAAIVAVLASYTVVGPVSTAFGATLTGSRFEIDDNANLTVDGSVTVGTVTTPNLDWLSPGAMAKSVPDDSSGGSDSSFAEGTHEDDLVPTVGAGSIPPNKSDLKSFGLFEESGPAGTFLNVYWSRVTDPSGDTNMDFEFNSSPLTKNDPASDAQIIPVRTTGDLLLTYDLTNGGSVADINARFWLTSKKWGAPSVLGANAIGRINTTTIAAPDSGGLGALTARTFGEAAINLTALMPVATVGCRTYGSVYLKSRASQSFNSTLKDFIPPQHADISNCGRINVHKQDDLGAPVGGATLQVFHDQAGALPVQALPPANGTLQCTTSVTGDCSITGVPAGTYWVHENLPAPTGYDAAPPQQVTVGADTTVGMTFVDPRQLGTITVTKDAVPDDGQDFTFSLGTDTVTLDDDIDATRSNTKSWTVPVGTYTLTETSIPPGWGITGLSCTGTGSRTISSPSVSITVTKGQTVACTYEDSFTPQDALLSTAVSAAGAGTWNDTATLTGDGTHPVLGSVTFYACAAQPTASSCAGGTQVGTARPVTLAGGSSYTATTDAAWAPTGAGWTCFRAVFAAQPGGFYASSSHSNATTECFFKAAADLIVAKTAHAAFGRLYSWTVGKSVDAARVEVAPGAAAISAYDVVVGHSHVDSAWTVSGTITVDNPNPVAFSGVTVTDAIDNGGGTCAVTAGTGVVVPAGGQVDLAYTCTYTAAPAPSAGTNTATASWNAATYSTPHGTASGTASVDFATVTPSVTDELLSVTDTVQGPLGTFDARVMTNPTHIRYTVDRSGIVGTCTRYDNTATGVAGDSGARTSSSAAVTVCAGADLTAAVTGDATKDRDDRWTITKRVDKTRVEMGQGATAIFTYEVEVAPQGSVDSGHALTGLVTATNPNDWEAVTADLTVTTDLGATCTVTGGTGVSVAASTSVSRAYSCAFSGTTPTSGTVTSTVTWNKAAAKTAGSSATRTAPVTFALASETHRTVTVVDDKTDPAHPVTLGTRNHAAGPHTYSYSVTKTGTAGVCTDHTNTASLTETGQSAAKTVTVCVGMDLTVTKTALATDHRTYLWTLTKAVDKAAQSIAAGGTATYGYTVSATPAGTTDDGWSVTGQISVTNPNTWRSVTATVTDSVDSGGGASCVVGNGSAVTIAAGATVTLTYACSFASRPADGTNTATATWDAAANATPHGTATGTAPVVFVPSSSTNETVTVVDDRTDPAHPVVLGTARYADGPKAFTYSLTRTGIPGTCEDKVNTATIQQTQQSASSTARLCVGQPLALQGTSAGSFDRDHLWTLTKVVDRTAVTAADGVAVVLNYTVTATPAGSADSGHALAGTATLTNPNTWEAVTADVTAVTDLAADASCTVTDGAARSVPAGGSVVLAFACAFVTAPAASGSVVLTATWDAAAASTAVGTTASAVSALLVLDQSGHDRVTVSDDRAGAATAVVLGAADWASGPVTFRYPLTKTAVADRCTDWTNTATLTETGQAATATSKVCGEAFTGGGGGIVVTPPAVLPRTGGEAVVLLRWVVGLVLGGAFLQLVGRRRQA